MSKVSTSHTACTRARVTLSVLAESIALAEIVFLNCAHNNASYRSAHDASSNQTSAMPTCITAMIAARRADLLQLCLYTRHEMPQVTFERLKKPLARCG